MGRNDYRQLDIIREDKTFDSTKHVTIFMDENDKVIYYDGENSWELNGLSLISFLRSISLEDTKITYISSTR